MPRAADRVAGGWALLLLAAGAAAHADEPRVWLERMNQALTRNNYEGEFQHWQRGKVENLRIIHRVHNGQVMERLVSLDGSGREFIRTGTELTCYLPDRRMVLVERRPADVPLFGGLPAIDERTASFYDITEVKRTRINRRDTRVIAVNPKDEFRYGYRLWIDESTAMPIRTQLCDPRGRVIEQINFTSLRLPSRIPDSAFQPEVSTEGFRWLRNDTPTPLSTTAPVLWSALRLPPGFRMSVRSAQTMPGAQGPVEHIVFTDGLASVSVFVEQKTRELPGQALSGSARVGSSSTFSTVIDGRQITAVGEVPPQTVRFIANSMKEERQLSIQPPRR